MNIIHRVDPNTPSARIGDLVSVRIEFECDEDGSTLSVTGSSSCSSWQPQPSTVSANATAGTTQSKAFHAMVTAGEHDPPCVLTITATLRTPSGDGDVKSRGVNIQS